MTTVFQKLYNETEGKTIENQLEIFHNYVSPSKYDLNKKNEFIRVVAKYLNSNWDDDDKNTNLKFYPFGSFVTGLGSSDSDIDIFVEITENGKVLINEEKEYYFESIYFLLQSDDSPAYSLRRDDNIHVPFIRFTDETRKIKVDLSFENKLGLQNSKLIKLYLELDDRLYTLIQLIKHWAKANNLSGSSKIKSYGIVLLVLTLCMQRNVIPTVYFLQNIQYNSTKQIKYWNAGFCNNVDKIKRIMKESKMNLSKGNRPQEIFELLEDFFKTYGNFEFDKYIVCPLNGKFISKDVIKYLKPDLPKELEAYRQFRIRYSHLDTLLLKGFCIQDPFELNYNVLLGTIGKPKFLRRYSSYCKIMEENIRQFRNMNMNLNGNFINAFISLDSSNDEENVSIEDESEIVCNGNENSDEITTPVNKPSEPISVNNKISQLIRNNNSQINSDKGKAVLEELEPLKFPIIKFNDNSKAVVVYEIRQCFKNKFKELSEDQINMEWITCAKNFATLNFLNNQNNDISQDESNNETLSFKILFPENIQVAINKNLKVEKSWKLPSLPLFLDDEEKEIKVVNRKPLLNKSKNVFHKFFVTFCFRDNKPEAEVILEHISDSKKSIRGPTLKLTMNGAQKYLQLCFEEYLLYKISC